MQIIKYYAQKTSKLGIVLFFLSVSCSSTPLPKNEAVSIPGDFFGFAHGGKTNTQEEYKLLDNLGVHWILDTFYWRIIESEQGKFDFSRYDKYVDTAKEAGKKIIGVLGYETPWLNRGKRRYISQENIPYYLNFVEETVRRYKGRVDAWSVWNEPNIHFWKGSNKEFFELSKLATLRIRETDPDAYIIGGVFSRAPKGFIRSMHKAGAIDILDGIAFHPYAINPAGSMRVHDRFQSVLSEINFTGPVWITEVGYPTAGWPIFRTRTEELPSYVIKTIAGAAARGTRALLWYELFDGYNEGELPSRFSFVRKTQSTFGLIYPNYQRKSGAFAFELCARYLPASRYTPELPRRENIPSSIVSYCFMDSTSGNNTLILWKDSGKSIKVNLHLPNSGIIHDISSGIGSPLPAEAAFEIGKEPLMITWQEAGIPILFIEKP